MSSLNYYILDVYTDRPFHGNPLAVVIESDELSQQQRQAISKELNTAVTAFIDARHLDAVDVPIKLFTPDRAINFASQPGIGVGVLLRILRREGGSETSAFRLLQDIGPIECSAELLGANHGRGKFAFPKLSPFNRVVRDHTAAALALGLEPESIGFGSHVAIVHASSNNYNLIPIHSLDALARIKPREEAFYSAFEDPRPYVYAYTKMSGRGPYAYRARMFWPSPAGPIGEDPAAASGAIALATSLPAVEDLSDGTYEVSIEQGFEMGRPSLIEVTMRVKEQAVLSADVGGQAIVVAKGELAHP